MIFDSEEWVLVMAVCGISLAGFRILMQSG